MPKTRRIQRRTITIHKASPMRSITVSDHLSVRFGALAQAVVRQWFANPAVWILSFGGLGDLFRTRPYRLYTVTIVMQWFPRDETAFELGGDA